MTLKKFRIEAEISIDEFMAENEEEATRLFWESIDDRYGVASSIINLRVEEEK